jgi:hypothetical protein
MSGLEGPARFDSPNQTMLIDRRDWIPLRRANRGDCDDQLDFLQRNLDKICECRLAFNKSPVSSIGRASDS